ncbi:hypothetical protein LUZ60_007453 [Juncus effusus]|nr:hypothetical protein LUZ60_007453 [Juncus effusus]
MAKLGFLLVCAGLLVVITTVSGQGTPPSSSDVPSNFVLVHSFGQRTFTASCQDTKKNKPGCSITCPNKCQDECLVFCPTCRTICMCELPGNVCGDPRFNGGDGNTFYFHGKKDEDFCIVSDTNLHINAHFIGQFNPSVNRNFTWVQSLGIMFDSHRLFIGAEKTAVWDDDVDRLNIAFDEQVISMPAEKTARWVSASAPELSISRSKETNGIIVELEGKFKIMANVIPITEKESKIHNYGVGQEDSLAHLDLGFKFYSLTDDVHGVLGQTYRPDYVNRLDVSKKMPVMGGAPMYVSSDIFATDCNVNRFHLDGAGAVAF